MTNALILRIPKYTQHVGLPIHNIQIWITCIQRNGVLCDYHVIYALSAVTAFEDENKSIPKKQRGVLPALKLWKPTAQYLHFAWFQTLIC